VASITHHSYPTRAPSYRGNLYTGHWHDQHYQWTEELPKLTRREAEQSIRQLYGKAQRVERTPDGTAFRFVGFTLTARD